MKSKIVILSILVLLVAVLPACLPAATPMVTPPTPTVVLVSLEPEGLISSSPQASSTYVVDAPAETPKSSAPADVIRVRQPEPTDPYTIGFLIAYLMENASVGDQDTQKEPSANGPAAIPRYREDDLLYSSDKGYSLGIDVGITKNFGMVTNVLQRIVNLFPDPRVRKKGGYIYLVYDTDRGTRLFLFFSKQKSSAMFTDGYPIVMDRSLGYEQFEQIKPGDSMEDVKKIDPVVALYQRVFDEYNEVALNDLKNMGLSVTSLHLLTDGILKIDYDRDESNAYVITEMTYRKDFVLDGVNSTTNYSIYQEDYSSSSAESIRVRQPEPTDPYTLDFLENYLKNNVSAGNQDAQKEPSAIGPAAIPRYREDDILYSSDKGYHLGTDAGVTKGFGLRTNILQRIVNLFPAPRVRELGDYIYLVYETDRGTRLFLFFSKQKTSGMLTDGYPIVMDRSLGYEQFEHIKPGDSLEDVKKIDPVVALYQRVFDRYFEVALNNSKSGGPSLTSLHLLTDGMLKIDYDRDDSNAYVVTEMTYRKDFVLDGVNGKTNYSIYPEDYKGE